MKKSIFMIIATLTAGCAACFAGCARSSDKTKNMHDSNEQRIVSIEETEEPKTDDGEEKPDCDRPDGNCEHRGPHFGRGRKLKRPVEDDFRFIIELNPRGKFGKHRPAPVKPLPEKPDPSDPSDPSDPEVTPAPDGDNN